MFLKMILKVISKSFEVSKSVQIFATPNDHTKSNLQSSHIIYLLAALITAAGGRIRRKAVVDGPSLQEAGGRRRCLQGFGVRGRNPVFAMKTLNHGRILLLVEVEESW